MLCLLAMVFDGDMKRSVVQAGHDHHHADDNNNDLNVY